MMNKTAARAGSENVCHPRKLLLSKKAEFLEALGINTHRLAGAIDESDADPVVRLQEETLNLGINAVLYDQLEQVEEALGRLEMGEYGCCVGCNRPIAPNRLQSVPWTPYCLGCQEQAATADLNHRIHAQKGTENVLNS